MPLFTNATALKVIDAVAIVLSEAYQLARCRIASAASPVLRMMTQRDQSHIELDLLRRELEILRGQRAALYPHKRPDYTPGQRLAILQLMRLRRWNAKVAAQRLVLHPNTVRTWIKAMDGHKPSNSLLAKVPWNKIDDAIRWAVHELRQLCPEPEFGTRTVARHLIRAGVQISRRTVQRVLREDKPHRPSRPRSPLNPASGVESHHLLTPEGYNRVWQLDLMSLRILWFRLTIAAMLDGCTRRLLQLNVYSGAPSSKDMIDLVCRSVKQFGKPRFLITDHGTQFRKRFGRAMKAMGITPIQGRVRSPMFNGKVERLFRTLRLWQRFTLLPLTVTGIQRRLDRFRDWHNAHRPHQALGNLTPEEAWAARQLPEPIPIRAADQLEPAVEVRRVNYQDDPRLPVPHIAIELPKAA